MLLHLRITLDAVRRHFAACLLAVGLLHGPALAQQPTVPNMATPSIPGGVPSAAPDAAAARPREKLITVDINGQPWKEVLADWFARESGLAPNLPYVPNGSLVLRTPKDRKYTLAEVVDLLNEALQLQKFVLIRREVTFSIYPADQKIDATVVPRIGIEELTSRGKTEIVQVLIPLKSAKVGDIAPDLQKVLTPFGQLSTLARTNTLVVLDTAGNMSRLHELIREFESASGKAEMVAKSLLVSLDPREMAAILAKCFPVAAGGPVIEVLPASQQGILVRGTSEQIAQVEKVVKTIEAGPEADRQHRVITLPEGSAAILAAKLAKMMAEMNKNPTEVVDPLRR